MVTDNVVLFDNIKLTIEPGVLVEFNDSKELEIRGGNLQAIGTNKDKIIFKSSSQNPTIGIWKGLRFVNRTSLDNSKLEFIEISHAKIAVDTKETIVYGSDPVWSISNSKFYKNNIAIDVDSSEENNFYNCIFENNDTAINSLNYSEVLNCSFENNTIGIGYAFDTYINNNIFRGNTGTALFSFSANIDGNLFENNNIALDIKLFTSSIVKNNIVINNNIGFIVKGESGSPVNSFFNNCIYNNTQYNIKHENQIGLNLTNNYWHTTVSSEIEDGIYHAIDDSSLGLIDFSSFQTTCEASNTLSTENQLIKDTDFSVSVFPNPADKIATIGLYSKEQDNYMINLFDSIGNLIQVISNQYYSSGQHNIIIETENLNSGVYLLRLRNNSKSITKKIIITH
ncbi:T9SS type A sorting domain-containing protein [Pseudotamlana agarivorans]|uniref:T9SS type A sorting domain-containing protein n=1 Tax=Pseudotamlana agarivorans TaxID=481183 RepID=UPI001471B68D|nr:T9SS type A sorting domain-containing protein [Tamlana agarivorans]